MKNFASKLFLCGIFFCACHAGAAAAADTLKLGAPVACWDFSDAESPLVSKASDRPYALKPDIPDGL